MFGVQNDANNFGYSAGLLANTIANRPIRAALGTLFVSTGLQFINSIVTNYISTGNNVYIKDLFTVGGNILTSSIITIVPAFRKAATEGNRPFRIFHNNS